MGRLNKNLSEISNDSNNENNNTNKNVYTFIDKNGNITQINKKEKDRIKVCIEPEITKTEFENFCVIGINEPLEGDCSPGIGLGFGDTNYAYAIYNTDL